MDEYMEFCRQGHAGLAFVASLGTDNGFVAEYSKLKTDEERFSLALEKVVRNADILLCLKREQKSHKESTRARQVGNISFKKGHYYIALENYTESIIHAVDLSEDLALAYANRSAALFNLEKYQNCVEDIDRALNLKYPDELKTKLHKRKGMCLQKLGLPGAESSFQEAEVWLEKMILSNDEIDMMKSELKRLIKAPRAVAKLKGTDRPYPSPEILTPNSEIPSASEAIELKYSEKWGRHYVAARKIKPGELLVVEKPYCMRLFTENLHRHCSYCLQVCWNLIPCKHCIDAAYCSKACEDKAWDAYHEVECPIIGRLITYNPHHMLWMSLRTAIKATKKGTGLEALREELSRVDSHPDPRTRGFSADGKFHSDQYRSIHSLARNVDLNCVHKILIGALWVGLTTCFLRETDFFGKKLTLGELGEDPNVIYLGALMLKHTHINLINGHGFGASHTLETEEHGHAVMAASSLFNHSCNPNTCRQWLPDRLAIYATMPIEKGEQIFDNYGPKYLILEPRARQQVLKFSWNLECKCIACIKNWPLLDDLPSYKKQVLTSESKKVLDKVLPEFVEAKGSLMMKGIQENVSELLNGLLKMIEILFAHTKKPCKELALAVEMLQDLYILHEDIFKHSPAVQFTPKALYEESYSYFRELVKKN